MTSQLSLSLSLSCAKQNRSERAAGHFCVCESKAAQQQRLISNLRERERDRVEWVVNVTMFERERESKVRVHECSQGKKKGGENLRNETADWPRSNSPHYAIDII